LTSVPRPRSLAATVARERLPPIMERTLTDDLKWAFYVLAGVVIGSIIVGANNSLMWGALIGVGGLIVALNVVRWLRRRGQDEAGPGGAGPTEP
jgi:hypothetical protein